MLYKNKDNIKSVFLKKVKELNQSMLDENYRMIVLNESEDVIDVDKEIRYSVGKIRTALVDVMTYYETNRFELLIFTLSYNEVVSSWNHFVGTPGDPKTLGDNLQVVKDNVSSLTALISHSLYS